ncbi:MAG: hypothetical protein HN509_10355 [Halobacteriovoraceae bacterium]|jgi:4-hydroxythreonine-4-phosphate dehydrogenase|nr:hypothetical protein [Halobacteriovoraceae bacterium]MBT5093827.1 hypothetical protein [Halobacteriovoraceae bacterium]
MPTIHVSQGHEQGIGIETFLKAFSLIPKKNQTNILLHSNAKVLEENLKFLSLSFKNRDNQITFGQNQLNIKPIDDNSDSQSLTSLKSCLKNLKKGDILLTLPTSKDQLGRNGYTEYLRQEFDCSELAMLFKSRDHNVLLLSDHISLKDVSATLNLELVEKKMRITLENYQLYFNPLEEVFLVGINPHAGEGGLLGDEEKIFSPLIHNLKESYPQIKFHGPLPGDTLHFYPPNKKRLYVYAYHDQGLAPFKLKNGLLALNITLGLPFLRMSVDHGTAFPLYGKNQASSLGAQYLLDTSSNILSK